MTQCDRMLKYMDDFGYITTYQAVVDLGIASPSRRICDLRQRGENIISETILTTNRYGEPTHYYKYRRG